MMHKTLGKILIAAVLLPILGSSIAFAKKETSPPSFKPGAKVNLEITIKAPEQWKLNHNLPLTLSFDEEYLKTAPFTVEETLYNFPFTTKLSEMFVVIPVSLKSKLKDGEIKVPMSLDFSICNDLTEHCALDEQELDLKVIVQSQADDEKHHAQNSGTVKRSILLPLP